MRDCDPLLSSTKVRCVSSCAVNFSMTSLTPSAPATCGAVVAWWGARSSYACAACTPRAR
eukprot:scaffold94064_cov69-Phaeocystis_antarctica.AAC.4